VWIGAVLPAAAEMQRIATDVGYSETAFLAADGSGRPGHFRVRYFSPLAEVPFCGHATIASGVALAGRAMAAPAIWEGGRGEIVLTTNGGPVPVGVEVGFDGLIRATLTSIATWVREPEPWLLSGALDLLGWRSAELDPALPPAVGFAGAKHLILAAGRLERLAGLDYPFDALTALMLEADLTTLQLVWREAPDRFRARDPFPVGGVVEDPATGAAAAALGAYLRELGEIVPPATFEIVQGVEMGRPSRITVSIVPGEAGVRVSGNAVAI
jgi:PhzF family phenazine biosynthesis protein